MLKKIRIKTCKEIGETNNIPDKTNLLKQHKKTTPMLNYPPISCN